MHVKQCPLPARAQLPNLEVRLVVVVKRLKSREAARRAQDHTRNLLGGAHLDSCEPFSVHVENIENGVISLGLILRTGFLR